MVRSVQTTERTVLAADTMRHVSAQLKWDEDLNDMM